MGAAGATPADPEMPVVGEELAVARALSEVSHQLVVAAADSLESALGRPTSPSTAVRAAGTTDRGRPAALQA